MPNTCFKGKKIITIFKKGDVVKVVATDPLAEADFIHYCEQSNYQYLGCSKKNEKIFIKFII